MLDMDALSRRMDGALFLAREVSAHQAERYRFQDARGRPFAMVFSPFAPAPLPADWAGDAFTDAFGAPVPTPATLGGRPFYAG